jgi:tRNA threonylcarbamoyl adenosine modification protein YeaZ
MRVLAMDTSLEACSVAVARDGAPPVLASEVIGRGHAERLFGMVDAAMQEAALAYPDLDRIAVTVGPGSFTGLRVGIAAARGFALALRRTAVGIGTLDVHAARARGIVGARPVLALLDARRDELYGQAFDTEGRPLFAPVVASAEILALEVRPGMVLAGSGAPMVAALVPGAGIAHTLSAPDIATVLTLALAAPDPVSPPRPLYLRAPDAKPQLDGKVARQ